MSVRNHPLYPTWQGMLSRCYKPHSKAYPQYGGRGIGVCMRWRASFWDFVADVGPRPDGMSLDRYPNNDGNYEPSNVRWATLVQQLQNSRGKNKPRFLTHNGETLLLSEWARRIGGDKQTLAGRLDRGWSVQKALDTPIGFRRRQYPQRAAA